jgi:hypothetical protein
MSFPMSRERKNINSSQMHCPDYVLITFLLHLHWPTNHDRAKGNNRFVDNSLRGHVGLKLCKRRFKMINKHRIKAGLPIEDAIPDRMINEFLRQCPYCQITNRLRLIDSLVRPIIHLKFYTWISLLSLMPSPDGLSCSPPSRRLLQRQRRLCSIISVDSEAPKSSIPTKDLHFIMI